MIIIFLSSIVTAGITFLFYDSGYGLIFAIPILAITYELYTKQVQENRKNTIKREFREILMALSNNLSAGMSVENAFIEAEHNIWILYGKNSIMQPELFRLNQKVQMGAAIEKQFANLAKQYRVDEMRTFSELFLYAKRVGGDYTQNIRGLASRMNERIGVKEELEAQLSEKMLELRIMVAVPPGILAYLKIFSKGFLDPLYHNAMGIGIMTVALVLYAGSCALGVYIIRSTLEV